MAYISSKFIQKKLINNMKNISFSTLENLVKTIDNLSYEGRKSLLKSISEIIKEEQRIIKEVNGKI